MSNVQLLNYITQRARAQGSMFNYLRSMFADIAYNMVTRANAYVNETFKERRGQQRSIEMDNRGGRDEGLEKGERNKQARESTVESHVRELL